MLYDLIIINWASPSTQREIKDAKFKYVILFHINTDKVYIIDILIFWEIFYIILHIFAAPPPGPSTSGGGSVGTAAGVAASSVAAPSNMGLVPAQQAHTPPQPTELPSKYIFYNFVK